MASKQKNPISFVKGISKFAEVHKPHEGGTYNGKFRMILIFNDDNELKGFEKTIRDLKAKTRVFDEEDRETGEQTGRKGVMLTKRAFFDEAGKVENPLVVVDENKDKLSPETLIGNGSEVTVAYTHYEYTTPAGKKENTLTMIGVQVTKLVEYTRPSGGQFNPFSSLGGETKKPQAISADSANSPF